MASAAQSLETEESGEALGSVSSVLTSAIASILSFSTDGTMLQKTAYSLDRDRCITPSACERPDSTRPGAQKGNQNIYSYEPVDFQWLRERCDGDNELVLAVLRSFCEQGQQHLNALKIMYDSDLDNISKARGIVFHSVLSP